MRKITSKYQQKKKEKRKQVLVSVVLIGILFVSIVGFGFQGSYDENNVVKYGGYEFSEQNGYWVTNIQEVDFLFQYNPKQIKEYVSSLTSVEKYYSKPIYIYSEDNNAEIEFSSNIRYLVERVQNACLEGKECPYEDVPIKTCEDNLIVIEFGEEIGIRQDKNCVYIAGKTQEDLIIYTDKLLFKLLNIE